MNQPVLPLADLEIRLLTPADIHVLAAAFHPTAVYEGYWAQQQAGERVVLVAWLLGHFAGYVTIVWTSHYPPFREANIPEIADFNVVPEQRRRKIGTALLDEAERRIGERSSVVGIGVGLYADYGAAQRMYILRGYVLDGRGIMYEHQPVPPGATTVVDDALTLYFTKRL